MVSEDKIIKQGIRQTEAWFKQFKKQVLKDLSLCDTWQEFLERTEEYTTGNVMVSSGYSGKMQDIIVQMLNDIKFKRASQRELIEQTIRHNVGNLITDVGEDIKNTTRQVVSRGYDEGLHPTQIGRNISKELDTINHKRARTIARTEVKRTDTIANYMIAKEDGATGFTVTCRPDCCPLCAKEYADIENHQQATGQYGKAIGGEKEYHIDDVSILPPFHANCRCTVYYFYDHTVPRRTEDNPSEVIKEKTEPTEEQKPITSENPRITELKTLIKDEQALAEKWRKRGNLETARTFENNVKRYQEELEQLQKPSKTPTTTEIPNKELIDDVLSQVLNDIGLGDKAPKQQSSPTIEKNIKTTHKSNLWENLADKHNMELIEASESFVKFHDTNYDTQIEFNINANKDWIDYTNSNNKARNMEDFLEFYTQAPDNIKKSSPTIKIVGSKPYDGVCRLSGDTHHIEIARSGYQELKLQPGSGNLQQVMYHEMNHAHDQRIAPDRTFARMGRTYWASSQKGGKYKQATTKDRRNRKKTGAKQFVSDYAKTGSSGGILTEDWAELGSIVCYRDIPDKSSAYLLEYNEYGELVKVGYDELKKRYPNKWKVLEEYIFGEYQCNW